MYNKGKFLVAFNRTSVELKRVQKRFAGKRQRSAFNRTSVELKRTKKQRVGIELETFNRTSVELKPKSSL